jgi:ribosomal protein L37AE/L43A
LPMAYEKKESQMRCPGCRRYSLKRKDERITCGTCGYALNPGEEARFRLYELLKQ